MREVINAVLYALSTGCQWRQIPKDMVPSGTAYYYMRRFADDGTLERIHHEIYLRCREQAGREASPTACVIDSQSVKGAEKGGARSARRVTMRARRSEASSAISWSIPRGF